MVELKALDFSYPMSGTILWNVNAEVPDGQIVAVLGENGAGKTTLLKLLAGLMVPAAGEILIDGKPPLRNLGDIAFISEAGSYLKDLTPKEYGDFLADFFPSFDTVYYEKLLTFFGLGNFPIKQMSKGQRAKAEVAAGMAKRTKYIIMDEPFVGKDMFTRQDFMQALAGTLSGEETIFITTHEIDEIENFVDRVWIIKKGKIAADIMVDDLRKDGKNLQMLMKEIAGYEEGAFLNLMENKEI